MKSEQFPDSTASSATLVTQEQPDTAEPKLFFDISSLLQYVRVLHCYSGIQRVIAMLLIDLSQRVDPERLYISYVSHTDGQQYCVRLDEIGAEKFLSPMGLRKVFFANVPDLKALLNFRTLWKSIRHEIVWFFRTRSVRQIPMVLGRALTLGMLRAVRGVWGAIFRRSSTDRIVRKPLSEVASRGDKLVLLDSTWSLLYCDAFSKAHSEGMVVHTLVHDLIPLVAASTTDGDMPKVFYGWLKASLRYTDSYMANSDATRADLEDFIKANGEQKSIRQLPLAQAGLRLMSEATQANILASAPEKDSIYAAALEIAEKDSPIRSVLNHPYVLSVSTIEPRKNLWRLLIAWKSMLDQGKADIPRLVLAGRKGWSEQEFDLLAGTSNLYGYVSVIEGPSDEDLAFLYRRCLFAAMPSLYEGWGLPVGEALSYGKTAVVSNSSSLPQVGQDLVEYCDPLSIESIAAAVLKLVENPARRLELEARIRQTRLRSWSDVARDLVQIVDGPAMAGPEHERERERERVLP